MDTFLYIAAAGVGAGAAAGFARGYWRRRDAERRHVDREAYRRKQDAARSEREGASVAATVQRFFPFVKEAWTKASRSIDPRERLRIALANTEGIVLGTADIGFDAVLPDSARRQHLVCLGKSGYGKTTIALRMIRDDLQRGRGVCILSAEAELIRDYVLGMIPRERAKDTILFRPVDAACTSTWNPAALEDGDDQALASGQLFGIFKQSISELTIGARADVLLSAGLALTVGRRNATLWSLVRLLEDDSYRAALVADCEDPYLKNFWTRTFPEYPAGATLPLANRLHQFLRLPQLRAALCYPISSFSIRDALANSRILLFDLSGLDVDATRLVGKALLGKFQNELMRRERVPESQRTPVCVHVDEFHQFAGDAEGTWRELLSRGRRFGLSLSLYTQHLSQIPKNLQQEIFGNVSSVIALNLSAGDAAVVRRELLIPSADGALKPVPSDAFVALPVGEGFARLGSGACALRVRFAPPIEKPDSAWGDRVRQISWKTYAAPPMPKDELIAPAATPIATAPVPAAMPGRGSAPHKAIQKLAKDWGEARGFRAALEHVVLGGAGRVDVVLERDDRRIAVEVAVANSTAEVVETVVKDVTAGFAHVVVVSTDSDLLHRSEAKAAEALSMKDREKVRFLSPDGLRTFLDGLGSGADGSAASAGYRVRIEGDPNADAGKRRTLARLVGTALLRRRRSR